MKEFINKLSKFKNFLYPIIGVGFFLLAWFIASKTIGVEMILPSPIASLQKLFELFVESEFWNAVGNTVGRAIFAFLLSTLLAIVFSIVGYVVPQFAKILSPIIIILRSIPTMSIILLALIWLNFNINNSDCQPVCSYFRKIS